MGTVTLDTVVVTMHDVKSEKLAQIGYSSDAFTLGVRFHPNKGAKLGKLYYYRNVGEELYDDFEKAESKGKFFNAHIWKNPEYPFTEILEVAPPADASVVDPLASNNAALGIGSDWDDKPQVPAQAAAIPDTPEDEDELKLQALAVVDQVKALVIVTPEEYAVAGNELVRLRTMRDRAQARVDKIRVPALETYRAALELQKDVITPYNEAEAFLDSGMGGYRRREKEERLRKEAEDNRKRREEAEAEQARKQKEAAEADAKIAEAQGRPEEAEEIRQQPLPLGPVRWVPAVLPRDVPRVAGIIERPEVWRWRQKPGEEHLVPNEYRMLNEVAINAAVRTQKGLTNIPGIEVWPEEAKSGVSPKKAGGR